MKANHILLVFGLLVALFIGFKLGAIKKDFHFKMSFCNLINQDETAGE